MSATAIIRTAMRSAEDVLAVLADLGLGEVAGNGLIEAMNKIDLRRSGRACAVSRAGRRATAQAWRSRR